MGAERELREMVTGWDKKQLQEFCAEKGMEWRFTTPKAPYHNGCAEAMVKTRWRSNVNAVRTVYVHARVSQLS